MKIERGDILMVNQGQVPGTSLQSGIRPVVVVSNNKANTYSPVVTVVPFTSRVYKKRYLPTHVFINRYEMVGLKRHGLVLAEQITSIDVQSIIQKCGHVSSDAMRRITRAVEIQTGVYEEGDYDSRRIQKVSGTDLLTVKADRNKSLKERRESYLNKVGNPYLVRIGNMKVKVRFANNGISLEQAFKNMLLSV